MVNHSKPLKSMVHNYLFADVNEPWGSAWLGGPGLPTLGSDLAPCLQGEIPCVLGTHLVGRFFMRPTHFLKTIFGTSQVAFEV